MWKLRELSLFSTTAAPPESDEGYTLQYVADQFAQMIDYPQSIVLNMGASQFVHRHTLSLYKLVGEK